MRSRFAAYQGRQIPLRDQIVRECQAMAEFAFARGRQVPGWVVQAIHAAACTPADAEGQPQEMKRLAAAHETLARVVTPATPQSLVMLDDEAASALSFLGPVPFVRRMSIAAMVTAAAFVVLSLRPEINDPANGDIMTADGMRLLVNEVFFMAAAGLGAAFHALFQANRYIVERSFDSRYEPSYWIRFLLGVIAGLIMVTLVPLNASSGHGFARPTLAMLGGFSAAAVYRILARLVETLESLVQGDARSMQEARERGAKLDADQEMARQRMKMAADLVALQQQLSAGAGGDELREQLARIVGSVMAPDAQGEDPAPAPARTIALPNVTIVGAPAEDASPDGDAPDLAATAASGTTSGDPTG
jgi:uncharacterized membrane protein